MIPLPEERRRLLPIIDEDETLLGYQSCSGSDVSSLLLPIDRLGTEARGQSARNNRRMTLWIAMTILVVSGAIIMTSTPFAPSSSIYGAVNRQPSDYTPFEISNLLGSAKPDTNNKKGGKVVVVQVVKIKFPQQTSPYGYYYPPPPGGHHYNGPLLPPTPPAVPPEKPTDQDWKKYRDKYARSEDKKKKKKKKKQKKQKQNEDLDLDAHSPGPSMSPPELNVSTDSSNRRTTTKPYNWQQWVKGGNSTASATSGDRSDGDSYDWQKWTNPNVTLNGSRPEDGGYDWHQWVDKDKAGAPSVEPSRSPTDHPTRAKSPFPTGVPSRKGSIYPSNLPSSTSHPDRPTVTTIFPHPSNPPLTQSKHQASPAGVVEPGRLLEDTFSIEVNVSCNSAFLEPVFHDFIEGQRVSHTLADNISLEDARQIAANLYQAQDGDGQTVIMYVDYDDDNHTADMVLVHGFDIFNNYREHFEFIPESTQSIQGNTRSAIRMPTPKPKCRIVRTLSAVLTSTAALGGITAGQWLSDHEDDMRKFKEYVESHEVAASTAAPIVSPVAPTLVPVDHRYARGPRASSPRTPGFHPSRPMSASMAHAPAVATSSPAPTLGTVTPTNVSSQVIPTADKAADRAAPTVAPTLTPIPVRSLDSTVYPTLHPTVSPTLHPTVTPTLSLTLGPTVVPTLSPTLGPTVVPTHSPTLGPTVAPTLSPTLGPTFAPTLGPTVSPTVASTPDPTVSPTLDRTITPVSHTRAPVKRRRREPVAQADIHKERKHES